MILYRGTPRPEELPRPREYAAVFFARSKAYAASYGEWINKYDVGDQVLLDSESKAAFMLAANFLRRRPSKEDVEELLFHPTRRLVSFLSAHGYSGVNVGDNIGLFDVHGIRLLSRDRGYYDRVCRFRRIE